VVTPMSFEHCFASSASNIIVEAMAHAIWNIIKWFLNLLWYILRGNQSTTFHWGDKTQQGGLAYSNKFLSWYTLIKYTKWHDIITNFACNLVPKQVICVVHICPIAYYIFFSPPCLED
jgi:hypothetical protein